MPNHNFGPCDKFECLTTRLFEVTNIATGARKYRICCRAHPGSHWRPAMEKDMRIDRLARAEVTR